MMLFPIFDRTHYFDSEMGDFLDLEAQSRTLWRVLFCTTQKTFWGTFSNQKYNFFSGSTSLSPDGRERLVSSGKNLYFGLENKLQKVVFCGCKKQILLSGLTAYFT